MKKWEKPQLVVMTRSKPEEAVLGFCKILGEGGGPEAAYAVFACFMMSGYDCMLCSAYVTS